MAHTETPAILGLHFHRGCLESPRPAGLKHAVQPARLESLGVPMSNQRDPRPSSQDPCVSIVALGSSQVVVAVRIPVETTPKGYPPKKKHPHGSGQRDLANREPEGQFAAQKSRLQVSLLVVKWKLLLNTKKLNLESP